MLIVKRTPAITGSDYESVPGAALAVGALDGAAAAAQRSRRRRRFTVAGVVVVGGLILLAAGVLVGQVLWVRSDLAGAPDKLGVLQDRALDGDVPAARQTLAQVGAATGRARSHSAGPVWWLGSKLPFVGSSLGTTRELVVSLDDLADGPLANLVAVADKINPDTLVRDGTVDLAALDEAREPIINGSTEVSVASRRVQSLPSTGLLGPVRQARSEAVEKIGKLSSLLDGAAEAVRIGPGMLGANGPRTYFIAFQNNAEIKGTGGLLGVFGVLTANHGKVDLVRTASNTELRDFPLPVVDLGPEFNQNYGPLFPGAIWSNANSSPHFPYAGRTWAAMYEHQFGTHIDGVIAADPEMLAHLLRATGPVPLPDGRVATADNVARIVEVDAYAEYDGKRSDRKDFLRGVAEAAFHAALNGKAPSRKLLAELGDAGRAQRLQIWSPRAEEMAGLRQAHLTGEMYQGPAPYAGIVLNNVSGAKLDYYLDRNISYTLGTCNGDHRSGRIAVKLTNEAPSNLPTFVTDRIDAPRGTYPPGQSRLQLSIYMTEGAEITGVALDGKQINFNSGTELGHPRITMWIYPTPRLPLEVTVNTREPVRYEMPIVPIQPMARAVEAGSVDETSVANCIRN
ncbi:MULTISPECIES: DUF4012 domain-containing protein [Frankia]|uniref:DUF4012 domain-containing protein n=1 Tax=Frankia TaxID=1854 RepID=UPI0005D1160B|nr:MULTISPECIES: DUF4012 domain-containing protein [Frankia]